MLNRDMRNDSLSKLNDAQNRYNNLTIAVKNKAIELYELRKKSSQEVITSVESYINKLANSPLQKNLINLFLNIKLNSIFLIIYFMN